MTEDGQTSVRYVHIGKVTLEYSESGGFGVAVTDLYACVDCGSVTSAVDTHNEFHEKLAELERTTTPLYLVGLDPAQADRSYDQFKEVIDQYSVTPQPGEPTMNLLQPEQESLWDTFVRLWRGGKKNE